MKLLSQIQNELLTTAIESIQETMLYTEDVAPLDAEAIDTELQIAITAIQDARKIINRYLPETKKAAQNEQPAVKTIKNQRQVFVPTKRKT